MKILYHHRIRSKDGQYVHIEELTDALKRMGHEIIVVGPGAVAAEKFGTDAGMVAWLKKSLPRFLYELMEFAYAFWDYRRLRRVAREQKPDCLYERYNLMLPSGVWLKHRLGLPMLLEVNAPLYEERSRYGGIALKALARWTERYTWCGADRVLPVTEVLARYVRRAGVSAERVAVIPNGINADRFSGVATTAEAKARFGLEARFVLGFVGFMREWHGLDEVIDLIAAHRQDDWHALLVGDGPARTALEQRARRLGVRDRVTLTGIVEREQVANYIAAFDVALQPHVVPYASPLKLFEYLVLARAIVAPATDNIREVLVDGVNAVLFDPARPGTFCLAVETLSQDPALRRRIADAAGRTIEELGLTWTHNAERVTQIFAELGVC